MAAQAVDFTLSGQVSRTLFVNDSDSGTSGVIRDNNGSTRVRANGHSVLDDGSTVGIQFEYAVDAGVTLRHANVQFRGSYGAFTFGQGSEAGDGSAGLGPGVTGIGAGQDGTSAVAAVGDAGAHKVIGYFGSLDGGGRTGMIRYDTPALGPVSAAVSLGNGDSVSGLLALSSEFSGTTVAAKVGAHQAAGAASQISASVGVTLASGLAVGGAWGQGDDLARGMTDGSISCAAAATATAADCTVKAAAPGNVGDPSYFRAGIGYTFGNTTVAASLYNSEDFIVDGSEGTAFGAGASHTLPKAGVTIHASAQNYSVSRTGMPDMDETVFQLGTLVTF